MCASFQLARYGEQCRKGSSPRSADVGKALAAFPNYWRVTLRNEGGALYYTTSRKYCQVSRQLCHELNVKHTKSLKRT